MGRIPAGDLGQARLDIGDVLRDVERGLRPVHPLGGQIDAGDGGRFVTRQGFRRGGVKRAGDRSQPQRQAELAAAQRARSGPHRRLLEANVSLLNQSIRSYQLL